MAGPEVRGELLLTAEPGSPGSPCAATPSLCMLSTQTP